MPIDTNVYRERIDYDYPYIDTLTENEEELYWSATKDAEDALARIAKVQERRKGENGEIQYVLLSDEFRKLNDAMEQLDEATTLLSLIARAAECTERNEETRSKFLNGEETRFDCLNELLDEQDGTSEPNGGAHE